MLELYPFDVLALPTEQFLYEPSLRLEENAFDEVAIVRLSLSQNQVDA
ncbi:MAG: hypothetical protein NVS9B12_04210 [Vulcanimicrobiaceae bacterium]